MYSFSTLIPVHFRPVFRLNYTRMGRVKTLLYIELYTTHVIADECRSRLKFSQ